MKKVLAVAGGALAGIGFSLPVTQAAAQTQLPEIVVRAPTPIRRTQPVVSHPARPVAAPASPEFQPPPSTDLAQIPPGVLAVVTDTFAPVTLVTKDELARTGGSTLGDVLLEKPGITGSSFAPGGASRPNIRGLDNFRVRVQENGVGSHDVSDLGEDHGVPIDPLGADQVEVIRGPATLRYGSQAIGGVVEVTNNRIPALVPPRPTAEFKGSYDTGSRGAEGATILDAVAGNFAIHGDAFTRGSGDYAIPGGIQANSGARSSGQSIGSSYIFDQGFAGLSVSHFSSLYHIPGVESAASNTRIDLDQIKVDGKGEVRNPFEYVDAIRYWVGASNYKHNEIGLDGSGVDGVRATFKNQEQEARVETQLSPFDFRFGSLTTAIGAQFGHQELSAGGEGDALLAPNMTTSAAAYVFNELKVANDLKFQAAGRIESVYVKGTAAEFPASLDGADGPPTLSGRSRSFTPGSFSLGVLKNLPWDVVATLNGQYVERAPRAPELFSKGAHDAPGTFEIGNADLKIESAKTVEAGVKRAKGAFRFDASVYYTKFSNFIYKQFTGLTCDDDFDSCGSGGGTEVKQVLYAQQAATFRGAEVATQLDILPLGHGQFGIDGQYDIVRATFDDGTNVPRMPPQRLGGGVFWRSDNTFARIGLLHGFAQTKLGTLETPTAAYDNLKAEVSYRIALQPSTYGPREMRVGIVGNNLLDADIRNSVSFRKDEVQLPGRSVRFFASMKY